MDVVEQIRQVAALLEIASQYTTLRKRGSKYVGLCPFHAERDPSFTLDPDKQLYHCFGCGAGGDVFSLVMDRESLNFPEAVKYLAERYHIPLPRPNRADAQAMNTEEKLFKINEDALAFFKRNLFSTEEGRRGLDYLAQRGLADETLQKLKVGYAPNSWTALYDHFQTRGVSGDWLMKAGLVVPGQKKAGWYDRFRGRVMFPIFNLTGKVVAFGGRTIFNAEPKYLNSPETPLYSKGRVLYGLNFTKEAVRDKGVVVLIEGYTDFTGLFQAGVTNCAASLGTSLTPHQVSLARRFAPRMVINYDGDAAGRSAALRAVSLCFEQGLDVSVAVPPDGLDPDAAIRRDGPEAYARVLSEARSGLRFLIDMTTAGRKLGTPEAKAQAVRDVVKEVEKIPDAIARSESLKLVSEHFGLSEDLLRRMVQESYSGTGPRTAGAEGTDLLLAEQRLLQILVGHPELAPFVFDEVESDDFHGLTAEPIFRQLEESHRQGKHASLSELSQAIGPDLGRKLSRILIDSEPSSSVEEALDCLFALRKYLYERKRAALRLEIDRIARVGDQEREADLQFQINEITKKLTAL